MEINAHDLDGCLCEAIFFRIGGIGAKVARLRHIDRLSLPEIGAKLGMSYHTVRKHLYEFMRKAKRLASEIQESD